MEKLPLFSTMQEFEEQFKTEEDCLEYLRIFKWPDGYSCPHQGAIGHDHIYLDEFTFRFNRRKSKARGLLFQRLVENAMKTDPAIESQILGGNYGLHHN